MSSPPQQKLTWTDKIKRCTQCNVQTFKSTCDKCKCLGYLEVDCPFCKEPQRYCSVMKHIRKMHADQNPPEATPRRPRERPLRFDEDLGDSSSATTTSPSTDNSNADAQQSPTKKRKTRNTTTRRAKKQKLQPTDDDFIVNEEEQEEEEPSPVGESGDDDGDFQPADDEEEEEDDEYHPKQRKSSAQPLIVIPQQQHDTVIQQQQQLHHAAPPAHPQLRTKADPSSVPPFDDRFSMYASDFLDHSGGNTSHQHPPYAANFGDFANPDAPSSPTNTGAPTTSSGPSSFEPFNEHHLFSEYGSAASSLPPPPPLPHPLQHEYRNVSAPIHPQYNTRRVPSPPMQHLPQTLPNIVKHHPSPLSHAPSQQQRVKTHPQIPSLLHHLHNNNKSNSPSTQHHIQYQSSFPPDPILPPLSSSREFLLAPSAPIHHLHQQKSPLQSFRLEHLVASNSSGPIHSSEESNSLDQIMGSSAFQQRGRDE